MLDTIKCIVKLLNTKPFIKSLFKELIYGGHLLSLGASGIVAAGVILYGESINVTPILIISYLISQIVYNSDHLKDISMSSDNYERSLHLKKTYNYQLVSVLMYIILFVVFSFSTNLSTFLLSTFIVTGGILYSFITKSWTKKFVGFKNWYIAFFWSLLIFLIPLHYSGSVFTLMTVTLSVYVFTRWLINSIVFDIKDVKGDRKDGLRTFPVEIGINKTVLILHSLNLLSGILISVAVVLGILPFIAITMNIFTIYSFCYLLEIRNMNEKNIRLISYTMVDGEYLIWPLVLIIASNLL